MLQEIQRRTDSGVFRRNSTFFLRPSENWYLAFKAIFEIAVAFILLVLAAPVIVIAGLLVKLTSRGPAFYCQVRAGRFGKPFTIYKLRTMHHNCESASGPRWSGPGDSRVTAVGRFLRRTHIDELPQLCNVLRGEMSLIGPRPERPEFVEQLDRAIPLYRERLLVRPGITGLAQLYLPPDTDLESVRRKLAYDIYYLRTLSFWLDFRILVTTGFWFVGAPVRFFCRVLRIPCGAMVERVYEDVAADASATPELQPIYV